ncbi:hypothetical protein H6F89_25670 [Cyanobacteria bacterium FACHB-63]|nr:hypothetical protein [Cyanobacteria bacterium FACHB-63]
MSRLFHSIVILSLASSISLPVAAESAPEVTPPVTSQPAPEKPVVSQTDTPKPQEVSQPAETRIPLASRIFAAPTLQQ